MRLGAAVAATKSGKPNPAIALGPPSPLIRRLSQSLVVLPAYQGAAVMADAPPAFTVVGLRYTRYSEDSIVRD